MADRRRQHGRPSRNDPFSRHNFIGFPSMSKRNRFDDGFFGDDFDHHGMFGDMRFDERRQRQHHPRGSRSVQRLNVEKKLDVPQLINASQLEPIRVQQTGTFITARFYAYLPYECMLQNYRLRILFFYEKNIHDYPVDIRCEMGHMDLKVANSGERMFKVVSTAEIPVPKNDDYEVVYFYVLEPEQRGASANRIFLYENLLREHRNVRYIEFGSSANNNNSRSGNAPNNEATAIEQIDGLVLFCEEQSLNTKQLKFEIIEDLLPIGYLNSPTISDLNSNILKRVLRTFVNIERSLCPKDNDFKKIFEVVCTQRFNAILTVYQTRKENLEDWEYLLILSIAYLTLRFEFEKSKDAHFLDFLFGLHKTSRLSYLNQIHSYFQIEDDKKLGTVLKTFLTANKNSYRLDNSIHALIAYYTILKAVEQGFHNSLLEMNYREFDKITIHHCGVENQDFTNFAQRHLLFYANIIEHDFMYAVLILNYFQIPIGNFQILEYYLPIQAIIYYFSFKVYNQNDEFECQFRSSDLRDVFSRIKTSILNTLQPSTITTPQNLIGLFNACKSLLRLMIDRFSKEFDCILDLVEICLRVYARLTRFNMEAIENAALSDVNELGFNNVCSLIERWFSREFVDSILIGFNIEKYKREDIEHNNKLIVEYKTSLSENANSKRSNINMDVDMMDDDQMFQVNLGRQISKNPLELRRAIRHFGLTNEYTIYRRLNELRLETNVQQQLSHFLVRTLFHNRIRSRVQAGQYEEIINFRVKFRFDTLGFEMASQFYQLVDKNICEQLLNQRSDQQQDLHTLVSVLREKNELNQSLLDKYIDYILSSLMNSSYSEFADLKFLLEWRSAITFLSLDLECLDRKSVV